MRDLAAPENSKRRALAHEKLRKELDRHKAEWDKFERDFQKSDATRMPLPSLDREPPVAVSPVEEPRVRDDDVDVRAVQRGGPFVVRHRTCVLQMMMMWMSGPSSEAGPSSCATAQNRRIFTCGSRTTPCGCNGAL